MFCEWLSFINLLTLRAFCRKMRKCILFGHFGDFQAGYGWIHSILLKKVFATWQHAFLSTSIAFYDIFSDMHRNTLSKESDLSLKAFHFFKNSFSPFLFLSFCSLIGLLGSLPLQKILRKHHPNGQFLTWSSYLSQEMLLWSFCSQIIELFCAYRVHTGPGKPEKSWNFTVAFSRSGKSWKVLEIC